MAEDNDDESFGDFKFASFPNQPSPSTTAAVDDDDDWGDFINHSNQINGGISISKPSDLFGVSHLNDNNAIAVHVQSPQKPAFNKPNGAIPLSVFGEEEEEEEEHAFSNANNNTDLISNKNNNTDSVKKGSDSNGSVGGITDLFSNLYNQRSHNGSVSISNIVAPMSNADGNANASNLNSDSVEENDDEDGWEFKSAERESGTKSQNFKVMRKKFQVVIFELEEN